jgi:hypothetical protein
MARVSVPGQSIPPAETRANSSAAGGIERQRVRPAMSALAWEFLKEEQKQRRQEIDTLIEKAESDQRNGLIFTGAYWAWVTTQSEELSRPLDAVAVCVPGLIMLFFFFRYWSLHRVISEIAEYTAELEWLFEVPEGFGWERYLDAAERVRRKPNRMFRSAVIFWSFLVMANALLALLYIRYARM